MNIKYKKASNFSIFFLNERWGKTTRVWKIIAHPEQGPRFV